MTKYYSPSRTLSLHWPAKAPDNLLISSTLRLTHFASGRQAIFALAQYLAREKNSGRVLLPVWVAEGVYLPFVRAGWQIVFYELNEEADPDWDYLEKVLQQYNFDLVVLIHYFGQRRNSERLYSIVNDECSILEDWAHSYPSVHWQKPRNGHWALFSPTKMIGTTDGAWLIGPTSLSDYYQQQNVIKHITYTCWQLLYLLSSTLLYHNIPRQTLWMRLSGGSYARSYQLLRTLTDQPHSISTIGNYLLQYTNHEEVAFQRTQQAAFYSHQLNNANFRFLGKFDDKASPWIGFPLYVNRPEHFAAYLAQHHIRGQRFTDRWWFYADSNHFPVAKKLWEKHFLLPINQRFRIKDIEHIITVANAYQGNT